MVNEVMVKAELKRELEQYLQFAQDSDKNFYRPKDMAVDIVDIVVAHIKRIVMSRMIG